MWARRYNRSFTGSSKFFRLKILSLDNSEIEKYIESLDKETKALKDEFFRLSWYMRGGVSSYDLLHVYSHEDRKIINEIIKENIEIVKSTKLPLL